MCVLNSICAWAHVPSCPQFLGVCEPKPHPDCILCKNMNRKVVLSSTWDPISCQLFCPPWPIPQKGYIRRMKHGLESFKILLNDPMGKEFFLHVSADHIEASPLTLEENMVSLLVQAGEHGPHRRQWLFIFIFTEVHL